MALEFLGAKCGLQNAKLDYTQKLFSNGMIYSQTDKYGNFPKTKIRSGFHHLYKTHLHSLSLHKDDTSKERFRRPPFPSSFQGLYHKTMMGAELGDMIPTDNIQNISLRERKLTRVENMSGEL